MDDALECLIRERAYEIWNTTGRPDGRAEQHWLLAEREVRAMLVTESPAPQPCNADHGQAAGACGGALVHPSGIEGLIFGSWATLSGERLSCVGPAEGPGHGGVEISDELLDPGLQHLLAGEVAAADKLSYQNGKPDFDLIEP